MRTWGWYVMLKDACQKLAPLSDYWLEPVCSSTMRAVREAAEEAGIHFAWEDEQRGLYGLTQDPEQIYANGYEEGEGLVGGHSKWFADWINTRGMRQELSR